MTMNQMLPTQFILALIQEHGSVAIPAQSQPEYDPKRGYVKTSRDSELKHSIR